MTYTIAFSGPAGDGVNTVGLLLAEFLLQEGYTVLCDKEYASIIKGDNNIFLIYLATNHEPIRFTNQIDLYVYFNEFAKDKNSTIYTLEHTYKAPKSADTFQNTSALGVVFQLLEITREKGHALLRHKLGHKEQLVEKNIASFDLGYASVTGEHIPNKKLPTHTPPTSPHELWTGNESIVYGAVASGADWYAAYPMTPASSLINGFVRFPEVTFFQGEDEIAVAMSMLGAKFAGKRALCGTSGGGFALMTESISFSNQAELGGVYILAQRAGPSTGTPTFTEQADIDFALHASFGDTKPIVLAPSTYEEAYTMIGKALNRSDIYQHPVIFLTDKQFSESYRSVSPQTVQAEPIQRGKLLQTPPEDFLRYQLTDDGISPYTLPGTIHGEFIAPSYEHSESGATSEDPEMKVAQTNKRAKKMDTFVLNEFTDTFAGYEIINPDAAKFFVSFGANRRVLNSYCHDHPERGIIILQVFQPFDHRLTAWFNTKSEQISRLVFVEMNFSGQVEQLVCHACNLTSPTRTEKITHIRKRSSYPIFVEDIEKNLG